MSIQQWYQQPEQELTRREVRWTLRWLFKGPGLKWLIIFTLLHGWGIFLDFDTDMPSLKPALGLFSLIKVFLWYDLILRRTLRPLSGELIPDLAITPFGHELLWPGLLAAPVTVCLVLGGVEWVIRLIDAAFFIGWDAWNDIHLSLTKIAHLFPQAVAGISIQIVNGVLWWMAMTAFVTRMVMPRVSMISITFFLIVGAALMSAPMSLWLGCVGPQPLFSANFALSLSPLLGSVVAFGLYYFSLKSLRGPLAWRSVSESVGAR